MTMETIKLDVADGIGWLLMNRPERMNGMTNQMLVETHDCLEAIAQRSDVRVVVLTGEGRGFCPGADLKHYAARRIRRGQRAASLSRAGAAARDAASDHRRDQRPVRRRRTRLGVRMRSALCGGRRDVQQRIPERRIRRRHGRTVDVAAHSRRGESARTLFPAGEIRRRQKRCSGDSSAAYSTSADLRGEVGKIAARLAAAPPHALQRNEAQLPRRRTAGYSARTSPPKRSATSP